MVTFADGGAFATTDINPGGPAAIGGWVSDGDSGFRVEFWTGSTEPDGTVVVIRVRVWGQRSGDHIKGTYQVSITAGPHHNHGSGTFHGSRIEP